ncbi:MAG: T9SS type A sorting domain-containing protein [Bacteroidales bacterium]|nr:T9SS type A sorting domain-containing protein [Bacteroidales bacterium]
MSKRNNIIGLFLILGLSVSAAAQSHSVVRDDYNELQLHITTAMPKIGETVDDGNTYTTLEIDGYMPSAEVGAPCLPTFAGLIEVPICEGYDVEITDAKYDTLAALTYPLLPSLPSRSKSDTSHHALIVNDKDYSINAFMGGNVHVETAGIARDRRLAHLEYCPIRYNPVSGIVVVCRSATIILRYRGADITATKELFQRYYSPDFASGAMSLNSLYPKSVANAAPLRYLIVAHSMFHNQLDSFVEWKRRKGFITDIVYTDDPAVGNDSASIRAYLRSQYTNATASSPAPTYLLLVGDVEQIPPFEGKTDNDHITDLYYTTWTTGDHLPDCYYGRFSAQNGNQLSPQIAKTLMYEQYTFSDPSFLDRAVMVAGVDGGTTGDLGYTHADPAMDYAIVNYINGANGFSSVRLFKNDPTIIPSGATNVYIDGNSSSMSATVRSYYNQGAGLINYSAHGSATSWGTPNFTTSHVSAMTNTQKFGIMIGNCCLTNKFETSTCLGEALLRKDNYCGAVGYIGGSNSTYWGEDFYWAVGVRSGISATMSMAYNSSQLGAYDHLCHTHNEPYSQWATSQGSLMMWGNMAVESTTSSLKYYYWEIYHLMGDPSVMTYLTQADNITITATSYIPYGDITYSVGAVPYAYVALTDTLTHTVVAATLANASGNATLTLPAGLPVGGYEIVVSAQQYRTAFQAVSIVPPDGAFPALVDAVPQTSLDAGTSCTLELSVTNIGNTTANNVTLTLAISDSTALSLTPTTITLDSLPAGDTLILTTTATIDALVDDGDGVILNSSITWSGSSYTSIRNIALTLNAPRLVANLNNVPRIMHPDESATFTIPISNQGHTTQPVSRITLTSPTSLLNVSDPSFPLSLVPLSSATQTFTIHADSLLPNGITIPLTLSMGARQIATLPIYIGDDPIETFEGNSYHTTGWTQGNYAWQITNSQAHQGSYGLQSTSNLDNNQTSMVTIPVNLTMSDSISFHYRVSSENNYDKFHFLIDEEDLVEASGEVDWTRFATLIPAGNHTLKFTYTKDYSVSNGSDCAWIDDVHLPHSGSDVNFQHDELCEGDFYLLGTEIINTQHAGSGSRVLQNEGMVTLVDYTIYGTSNTTLNVTACDSYSFLDNDYTASDSLVFNLDNIYGCDSTITLLLTINYSVSDTITDTIEGTYYQWNSTTYTESGQYEQCFTTVEGCDSTVTLLLTLLDPGNEGITEARTFSVNAYPNPTTGMVRLNVHALQIDIYDVQGRLVKRLDNTDTIDLSVLPTGTYTLRLLLPEGIATGRIVRQ